MCGSGGEIIEHFCGDMGSRGVVMRGAKCLSLVRVVELTLPFVTLPCIVHAVKTSGCKAVIFTRAIVSCFMVFMGFKVSMSTMGSITVGEGGESGLDLMISSIVVIGSFLYLLTFFILLLKVVFVPCLTGRQLLCLFTFFAYFSRVLFPM